MEKTILYSKDSSLTLFDCQKYESCGHQHCKELVKQIHYLTSLLNDKNTKIHSAKSNLSLRNIQALSRSDLIQAKGQQNLLSLKTIDNQIEKSIEEEISSMKKKYLRIRKQLEELEFENDELFDENSTLKKEIENLKSTISSHQNYQKESLSILTTRYNNEDSSVLELTVNQQDQHQESTRSFQTANRSPQSHQFNAISQINPNLRKGSDCFSRSGDFSFKFDSSISGGNVLKEMSTDRSQIYEKYELLVQTVKEKEREIVEIKENLERSELSLGNLENQNYQLKKIIKMRNGIQNPRHEKINEFKNILDAIQV